MSRLRVLFICGQNSARSQMAEALLDHLAGDRYEAHSAGLEPAPINPLAVQAMAARGIDISGKRAKLVEEAVAEMAARGESFDAVITVCSKAAGNCPYVPGVRITERWNFDDPGQIMNDPSTTPGERLERVGAVRDDIERTIRTWLAARNSGQDEEKA